MAASRGKTGGAGRSNNKRRPTATRNQQNNEGQRSAISWYGAGVVSGIALSFLLYLGTVTPDPRDRSGDTPDDSAGTESRQPAPPKPSFDFYEMLPQQTIDVEVDPADIATTRQQSKDSYLLQAGSFRELEDADRRRAELLLLGLEPSVEEASGDNGRWFRVYLGPFDSQSRMARARSLTTAQGIDTLLLKRPSN